MTDDEILDNIDRDPYPHKLEFKTLWASRAVIAFAASGLFYWVQLFFEIAYKIYRLFFG